jgi:hypothetical protein
LAAIAATMNSNRRRRHRGHPVTSPSTL